MLGGYSTETPLNSEQRCSADEMSTDSGPERRRDGLSSGFSASLSRAGLADLVQMHCLAGTQCVARVTCGEQVGYLYFRAGQIVHAISARDVGEAAALEILSWTSGAFELCSAGWPESESIQAAAQTLLLRAAQARDEAAPRNAGNLVRLPLPRSEAANTHGDAAMTDRNESPTSADAKRPSTPPAGPQSGVTRVQAATRIDANGTVLSSRGLGADELAGITALSVRLGRLIGEALGLDQLAAIEGASASQRTLIVVEKSGCLVGMRAPSDADLTAVRERYGV